MCIRDRVNVALRPQRPKGLLVQDGHSTFTTVPELCLECSSAFKLTELYQQRSKPDAAQRLTAYRPALNRMLKVTVIINNNNRNLLSAYPAAQNASVVMKCFLMSSDVS